jgi:hypothetical protein
MLSGEQLLPSFTLKMEAACPSEMSVTTYLTTRVLNDEKRDLGGHRRKKTIRLFHETHFRA